MESAPLKFALIVGSTRPNRFADIPVRWTLDGAAARTDFALDVLDLRDWNLPFFEEPVVPIYTNGAYANPIAEAWRLEIGKYDGFIATAAEYNHAPTGVLKNAFDSAFFEWNNRPISFVGYGGVGGARAIEHLRMIAIEMQMAPIKHAVHIGMEPFLGVRSHGKSLDDYPFLVQSRTAMFDQLVWWASVLKAGRESSALMAGV